MRWLVLCGGLDRMWGWRKDGVGSVGFGGMD